MKKIPTIKEKIIRIVEEYGELSLMNNKLELKGFNILSKSITYALKVLKYKEKFSHALGIGIDMGDQ